MRNALVLAAMVLAFPLAAQAPAAVAPTAMKQLDWLVGEWRGTGSSMTGPGQQHQSGVTERATRHAGGHVLVLQGVGKAAGAPGADSIVVHDAFGIIWHDRESGKFMMKAFRSTGEVVDSEMQVGDGTIVWGFADPRGVQIRFTVSRTPEGRWHEIGEASRDGAGWMQFMEMTLDRVSDRAALPGS